MLPLLKDNTQLLLRHLLSRSLEPAGQKENTGNKEGQTNLKKTNKKPKTKQRLFLICMCHLRSLGRRKIIIYIKPIMFLLWITIF